MSITPTRTIQRRIGSDSLAFVIGLASMTLITGGCGTNMPGTRPGSPFGDGSLGDVTIATNGNLLDLVPDQTAALQFRNLTISSAVNLPSGTVIRCTGTFTLIGALVVDTGAAQTSIRETPAAGVSRKPAQQGQMTPATVYAAGGNGGVGLTRGSAAALLDPPAVAGGAGAAAPVFSLGGDGGGAVVIIAQGAIVHNGTIRANGTAGISHGGGGAGGIVILASAASISGTGTVEAQGGAGGLAAVENSALSGLMLVGAGGGGGGGLIHLISPTIAETLFDKLNVGGGEGGPAFGAAPGSVFMNLAGGSGGGACVGNGGRGNGVNQGSVNAEAGTGGDSGALFITNADPTNLF